MFRMPQNWGLDERMNWSEYFVKMIGKDMSQVK